MAIMLEETDTLPSEAIVKSAEEKLTELVTQKQEGEQRLSALREQQSSLLREQGLLSEQRAALEEQAVTLSRNLQQAEMDAHLAATSPAGLATAREKLRILQKGNKASDASRKKDFQHIAERTTDIAAQLETLQADISQEVASLQELTRQEGLVRTSRNSAFAALGEEIYKARSSRLDERLANLATLAAQLVDAQIALRNEKEATYIALGNYGQLREHAILQYDLLEDSMSRVLDVFEALYTVLETEHMQVIKIGTAYLPRELELTTRELEAIFTNPTDKLRIVKAKRNAVRTLKSDYQVKT